MNTRNPHREPSGSRQPLPAATKHRIELPTTCSYELLLAANHLLREHAPEVNPVTDVVCAAVIILGVELEKRGETVNLDWEEWSGKFSPIRKIRSSSSPETWLQIAAIANIERGIALIIGPGQMSTEQVFQRVDDLLENAPIENPPAPSGMDYSPHLKILNAAATLGSPFTHRELAARIGELYPDEEKGGDAVPERTIQRWVQAMADPGSPDQIIRREGSRKQARYYHIDPSEVAAVVSARIRG